MSGDLSPAGINSNLKAAKKNGFSHIICRLGMDDNVAIWNLSCADFYLTDIGITWWSDTLKILKNNRSDTCTIRHATTEDLPLLAAEVVKLFRLSRFYGDPFFSEADANRMHVAWITNSVSGKSADVVLINPDFGFVTCKTNPDGHGEIPLIGVWSHSRRQGAGRELMIAAASWFSRRGIEAVRVKTQVKNMAAMNFYHRLGFNMLTVSMTMSCNLEKMGGSNYE